MLKTGKKPAAHDPKLLQLAHFEKSATTPKAAQVGFDSTVGMNPLPDWGMLGNDRYGDCGWAGADHETEILTHLGGKAVAKFSDHTALADYSHCTGFNINDPSTDQGTDIGQEMKYRRKTGVIDTNSRRHKIGAYIALEPGNWTQMLQGLYAFGVVGIGIEFPDYAEDQFGRGVPWTVLAGAPAPTEGHYIPGVAYPKKNYIEVITWARKQLMSKAFYQKYNDESYVFVTLEDLQNGVSPSGYNMTDLNSILAQL